MNEFEVFSAHRPLLFSIAYRMLGSVMDAEDLVQEAYLRWRQASHDGIELPKSYLSTIVTRLCIDQLKSARTWREQYVGPWLPEPIVTEEQTEMAQDVALADSLSLAFLVVLENLSPVERAVFLLRDVFGYGYPEIAGIVDKSEANCRKLLSRARRKMADRPRSYRPSREQITNMLDHFLRAARQGEMQDLLDMLSEGATVWSDGGGKVAAAINPVSGRDKVARLFIGLWRHAPPSTEFRIAYVNGTPGVVVYVDGKIYIVASIDIDNGKPHGFRLVVNPDKLRHVPPLTGF